MTDTPSEREGEGSWAKLRRRKVVQWGLAYAAGAWALLQVIGFVADAFHWPDAAKQVAAIVFAIGFPIAVALAWYHGDRGQQEVSRAELAILSVLVLLGGGALWLYGQRDTQVTSPPSTAPIAAQVPSVASADEGPSIAVLPFENRSRVDDDAFFVDGIHDDILTQLSKVSALRVISRTSVEQFRDTKLPTKAIAEQLGVKSILEGGVQRAGDRVRINVQLIDAGTDAHLWAESYDRELTAANIFAIQSEVAAAIAAALKATLTAGEKARLRAVPTRNLAAWEAYQLGQQRMARRTSAALEEAVRFFQRAIELDAEFALAYVGLANALALRVEYGGSPEANTMRRATAAAARAVELDPDLAEANTSAAWLAVLREDWAAAETGFRRAIELNPNYATAHHWCSRLFLYQGRYDQALRFAEKAAELDPLSAIINVNLGNARERSGQFGEALAAYRKAIEVDPAMPNPYLMVGSVYANAFGRLDQAAPWLEKAAALDPGNATYALALTGLYLDLGADDRARLWLDRAGKRGGGLGPVHNNEAMWHLYSAQRPAAVEDARQALALDERDSFALELLLGAEGQAASAAAVRAAYERAFPELTTSDPPDVNVANYPAAIIVALLLHTTGEPARAAPLLDGCETAIRRSPRMGWFGYRIADARIMAVRGQREAALSALRTAAAAGWRGPYWRYHRDFDAALDSVRQEPEFAAIFADIERDMARQRAELAKRPKDAPLDLDPSR